MHPPAVYALESRAPTVYRVPLNIVEHRNGMGESYVVNQCDTLHVKVLPVKRVLEKLYYVMANCIACRETFGPC
jgi:hypothetical protein